MQPLYEDPCFTFRCADDRIISRFRLEGVETGSVCRFSGWTPARRSGWACW